MSEKPESPEFRFAEAVERVRAKTGSPQKGGNNLGLDDLAKVGEDCKCKCPQCGADFMSQALRRSDITRERPVPRLCTACCELAETRNTARLAEMTGKRPAGPVGNYGDAVPLRTPFKDD